MFLVGDRNTYKILNLISAITKRILVINVFFVVELNFLDFRAIFCYYFTGVQKFLETIKYVLIYDLFIYVT